MAKLKRQTIGDNPLDGLMIETNTNVTAVVEDTKPTPTTRKATAKQRITVQISEAVIERVKNAVYWTPGLTLASLAEESLAKAVDQLEGKRKAKFPHREEELKTGRPIH